MKKLKTLLSEFEPSDAEWKGVAGHAREAATMLDILADDGASPAMLRREAANMRWMADGIEARPKGDDPLIEILLSAHNLELLAHKTANAARKKQRDEFQQAWGRYWKCPACGGWLGLATLPAMRCQVHRDVEPITNGYAPPPETP